MLVCSSAALLFKDQLKQCDIIFGTLQAARRVFLTPAKTGVIALAV